MITIFCEQISPRVFYTFELVFEHLLGIEFNLISDQEIYSETNGAKLCYGNLPIGDSLFCRASGLLNAEDITEQSVEVGEYNGLPALFKVEGRSDFEYDLFSSIFYLVTRYEEYLTHEEDIHGRYIANQSIAFKNDFLELPIVDMWALMIGQKLSDRYQDFKLGVREFQYINTIDIDNAFAYSGKGSLRTVGGIAKSALRLKKDEVADRVGVASGRMEDPYDTYAYMKKTAAGNNSVVKSFVLLGDYGPYDKNLHHSSEKQIQAIQQMAEFSEVGVHPSYKSEGDLNQIQEEIRRLSDIINKPVKISRQHYLKLKIPDTYRILINCGIAEDHSMGYSEVLGFRAGTCTPFKFYDLELETTTDLMVHPFALMDRTLKDYLKLNPGEAIERITKLADEVKNVNGTLVSVWHNESLSDEREWKGWIPVYEYLQRFSYAD